MWIMVTIRRSPLHVRVMTGINWRVRMMHVKVGHVAGVHRRMGVHSWARRHPWTKWMPLMRVTCSRVHWLMVLIKNDLVLRSVKMGGHRGLLVVRWRCMMIEIVLISNMNWWRHKSLVKHLVGRLHGMWSSCLGVMGRVGLMLNVAGRTLRAAFAASLTSVCAIWVLNQSQRLVHTNVSLPIA